MNSFSNQTPVGEIAAVLPLSTRIFERLGIDFCCGGKTTLSDACRSQDLEPAAVLNEITALAAAAPAVPAVDWTTEPIDRLIDHILTTHHVYMKTQLPRVENLLAKAQSAHSARHGEVLGPVVEIFGAMKQELEGHLMKEEVVLFPLIRRLAGLDQVADAGFHCGSVRNPLRVMLMEHDSAGEALSRLRSLTSGYTPPPDGCNTFRAAYAELAAMESDLHQHIHLENNILFPRALALESAGQPVQS